MSSKTNKLIPFGNYEINTKLHNLLHVAVVEVKDGNWICRIQLQHQDGVLHVTDSFDNEEDALNAKYKFLAHFVDKPIIEFNPLKLPAKIMTQMAKDLAA